MDHQRQKIDYCIQWRLCLTWVFLHRDNCVISTFLKDYRLRYRRINAVTNRQWLDMPGGLNSICNERAESESISGEAENLLWISNMTHMLHSAATVTSFLTAHDMWIVLMLAAVAVSTVRGSEQLTYDHCRLHAAWKYFLKKHGNAANSWILLLPHHWAASVVEGLWSDFSWLMVHGRADWLGKHSSMMTDISSGAKSGTPLRPRCRFKNGDWWVSCVAVKV